MEEWVFPLLFGRFGTVSPGIFHFFHIGFSPNAARGRSFQPERFTLYFGQKERRTVSFSVLPR